MERAYSYKLKIMNQLNYPFDAENQRERERERVRPKETEREIEKKGTLRKLVCAQRAQIPEDHTHNGVPMHLWVWV